MRTLISVLLLGVHHASSPRPSGYYYQETDQWIMQVNVRSDSFCDIEFGAKRFSLVYNISETPYEIESDGRIIVFPSGAENHPVVAAMANSFPATITFPCFGEWFPADNRITIVMNINWNLVKIDSPYNLFDLVKPDGPTGLYLYFGLLDPEKIYHPGSAPLGAIDNTGDSKSGATWHEYSGWIILVCLGYILGF
jgi:hypothetical protein